MTSLGIETVDSRGRTDGIHATVKHARSQVRYRMLAGDPEEPFSGKHGLPHRSSRAGVYAM